MDTLLFLTSLQLTASKPADLIRNLLNPVDPLPVNYIVPSRWEMKDLRILFVENCQLIPKLVTVLKSDHKKKLWLREQYEVW